MTHPLYAALAPFEKAIPDTTIRDVTTLLLVPTDGPVTFAALAVASGLPKGSLTRWTDKIIEAGLVIRKTDPADGRGKLIALTAKGRKLVVGRA